MFPELTAEQIEAVAEAVNAFEPALAAAAN
jgi:hypothetical protein